MQTYLYLLFNFLLHNSLRDLKKDIAENNSEVNWYYYLYCVCFLVTNITEGKQPPFYIGTLSCMDPEQNNCTYQIQSIQWKDFIEVRGNALYGITSLDYERHSTIDIDIQATDTGTPSASFVDKLSISVVDENETPLDITVRIHFFVLKFQNHLNLYNKNVFLGIHKFLF